MNLCYLLLFNFKIIIFLQNLYIIPENKVLINERGKTRKLYFQTKLFL